MTGSSMATGFDVTSQEVTSSDRKWMIPLGMCSDLFEVLCSTPMVFSITSAFSVVFLLNNLRVKWMKWYIRSPKSPSRRSLCIYPGLWLALYRGCINLLFFSFFYFFFYFHSSCLRSNNTNLCTKPVASTVFSKSLVTSVMLCPAHRWMS